MASKEEIRRVDKAHARADEAVEQMKAGHIITSCDVLFEDENNGERVTWTLDELESWSTTKAKLIQRLAEQTAKWGATNVVDTCHGILHGTSDELARIYAGYHENYRRARVMYLGSAAYLAKHPPADPYRGNREREGG